MKNKHLFLSGIMLIVSTSLIFTGCRKEKTKDVDTSIAADNALSEQDFSDMHQISDEASRGSLSNYKSAGYSGILSSCATITFDTLTINNKSFTIDFGSTPCLCHDLRYRKGKIFVYIKGVFYWDTTSSITITTTDPVTGANTYFVGADPNAMHQVIGTYMIKNNGRNSAFHLNWTITANGQIIKANGQGTITWNATRTRTWIAGELTPFYYKDDVYTIAGSASGSHSNGASFSMNITSPLVKKLSCRWISAGTYDLTPVGKPLRHVDFSPPSNGACDNIATVTINGNVYTVHML